MARPTTVALSLLAVLPSLVLAGCEDKETDTELCREVYTALCERAYECEAVDALNACVLYYLEDCRGRQLHRGVAKPTDAEVARCVAAIETLGCTRLDPTTLPDCPFLLEPEGDGDGDVDGDSDGDADGDGEPDGEVG